MLGRKYIRRARSLVRTKPNISTLAAESSIMFVNNKTAEWLNSKTEQEREALILSASKQVRELKTTFKNRSHEIKEQRKIKIQEHFLKKRGT